MLAKGKIQFDHVWIMEDDVFFYEPTLAREMVDRFRNSDADLLASEFGRPSDCPDWANWGYAEAFEPAYRARCFLPLSRFSKSLISHCHSFVAKRGSLCFIEAMFPSLVVQCSLKSETLDFLTQKRFRFRPPFNRWELIYKSGQSLRRGVFHPVKSHELSAAAMSRRFQWTKPSTLDVPMFMAAGPAIDAARYVFRFMRARIRRSVKGRRVTGVETQKNNGRYHSDAT